MMTVLLLLLLAVVMQAAVVNSIDLTYSTNIRQSGTHL